MDAGWASTGRLRAGKSWPYLLGRQVVARFRSFQLAVLMLMAINVFYGLSSATISNMDEARYGVAASEMLDAHDWLVPTYAGQTEYWNLKPPLGYWLIEGSYALFGRTVLALRLPSALCALGVVFLTMQLSRRWFGRRVAILAGLFVTTCFGFMSHHGARSGDLDAALTLVTLLLLQQVPNLSDSPKSRFLFGLLCAIGFLLKSFAILPFVLTSFVYLAWVERQRIRWRDWSPALLVFVLMVGSWMVMRTIRDGSPYFVLRMTYEDLLMRATQEIDSGSAYAPWGYVTALFDRFAPWPVFLLVGWIYQFRATSSGNDSVRDQPAHQLVMLWVTLPLGLFSLAHTHHHWYLDPLYPVFGMLSAIAVLRIFKHQSTELARGLTMALVALSLISCEGRVIARCLHRDRMPYSQTFLASLAKYNRASHTPLHVAFNLSHSERFLLQVVCGFNVHEHLQSVDLVDQQTQAVPGLFLYRTPVPSASQDIVSGDKVLVAQDGFLLSNHSSVAQTATNLQNDSSLEQG